MVAERALDTIIGAQGVEIFTGYIILQKSTGVIYNFAGSIPPDFISEAKEMFDSKEYEETLR